MPSNTITIDEVYGGGGNSNSIYKNDYIVIHNTTNTSFSVEGWSVQYASSTAGFNLNGNAPTVLHGSIAAGGYFLIQEAAGAGGTVNLPAADATGSIALSATGGRVALVNNSTGLTSTAINAAGVVDYFAYGPSSTPAEGSPTAALSNTTSALRNNFGNADTDNNSADFSIRTPDTTTNAPFNSASPSHPGSGATDMTPPTLTSTTPANTATGVAVGSNIVLTFSEAVALGTGDITLFDTTDDSRTRVISVNDATQVTVSGSTVTINPAADLHAADAYRVQVDATAVTDLAGNAFAGGADLLDFSTTGAVIQIPGGNQPAAFSITMASNYQLASGATLSETANNPAISATVSDNSVVTSIDIEGRINGFSSGSATTKGANGLTAALANGIITVGATASIVVTDAKGLNFNQPAAGPGMTVTNLGSIISHTATNPTGSVPTASQASGAGVDFSAVKSLTANDASHVTGGTLTNGSAGVTTALIQSDSADGVDLGNNQTLTNYGRIVGDAKVDDSANNNSLNGGSTTKRYSASVGVEINAHSHDTVDNFGTIEGSQHGVDGGDASDTDLIIINEVGGVITGHNGSGVGSDATAVAAANVVVTNSGTITGASNPQFDRSGAVSQDGDGDGVDIDGGATVTNTHGAVIQGTGGAGFDSNGRANHSEGLSLGGGIVENHGTISGADYGITVNNDGNANRSGVASTQITNESDGVITGVNGYAIRLENKGADSLDTDTITNHGLITGGGSVPAATGAAVIQGGASDQNTVGTLDGVTYGAGDANSNRFVSGDGSAIQTGEGNDTVVNDGVITGINGHAISLEGGDDTLTLYAAGTVSGAIDGGVGSDTLNLTTGATGAVAGTLTGVVNFEMLNVQKGAWTLTDAQTYTTATITAGASLQLGAGGTGGALTGAIVDNGALIVNHSDAVTLDAGVTGAGTLAQIGTGTTTLSAPHAFASVTLSTGVLDVAAAGAAGAGAITFAPGSGATPLLRVEAAATTGGDFAPLIRGFATGDTLDAVGVGSNASATLGANNVLTVTGSGGSQTYHLDPTQSFTGKVFTTSADANGTGVNIVLANDPNAPVTLFSADFTDFTAAGFAPGATAASGQLDSNIWRVVGLSDSPTPAYGFTGAAGTDFGRGIINGTADPTTGGVYSPSANHALVLQPTGTDLANGYIEAHIVNGSGAAANPPTLNFDWTFRNSGGRSDALSLSYSTDDVNFTAVSAATFDTPAGADATTAASFSTQHESLVLDGLNVPAGGDLYIRWARVDLAGSGNRDEVGIDNVLVQAAPSTPVTGTAFSISALSANKVEGAAGASTPFTFTVTRAGDTTGAGDVNYAVAGSGTHPADASDFTGGVLPSGTLHFAAGQASQTLTIGVAGDAVQEATESFSVSLTNPTAGAVVSGSAAVGTIQNDDVSVLAIGTVQGAGHTSPFNGSSVTVAGAVTQVVSNGFYVQDSGDGNAATSDGVLVFTSTAPTVQVGQLVQVTGTVTEYAPTTNTDALTVTELNSPIVTITDAATTHTVAPVIIGAGGLLPPTEVIASDNDLSTFHPTTDGLDFYESLAGMVVTVKSAQAVDATYQGQTWVVADNGAEATGINARGGITISQGDFNPERIQVYKSDSPNYVIGDHLGDVTGVITYFASGGADPTPGGNYELLPSSALPATGATTGLGANLPRPVTTLQGDASHLAVAAYNVENLDPTDPQARFDLLGQDIVTSLKSPDIISLEEVQDADGAGAGTNYSGAATAQKLIASIVAKGGPQYTYVEVAPTANNQNGGEPNGNIRTGFLYNPNRVQYEAGSAQLVNDATPGVGTRTGGDAFFNSRHPLVANFDFNGQQVTVVGVHNYSRGGSQELFGANQPALNNGDDVRLDQSTELANFLVNYKQTHPNIVVAGDFNAYYNEASLQVLSTTAGLNLTNLVQTQALNERYSTEYEGNAQQIDNLLVSSSLLTGAQFQTIHVNSGQATANQASDHDPIVSLLAVSSILAKPDTYAGTEDTTLSVDAAHGVLSNDQGANGQILAATLTQGPAHGTLNFAADGSFTYKPDLNFNGSDSFTYQAQGGSGEVSQPTSVTLSLAAVNDAPKVVAGAPSAILVEAGTAGPGTSTSVVVLSPSDVDSVVNYDTTKWTNLGNGLYSENGVYGSVQLDTIHNLLTYSLDNSRARTDALAEGAHVKEAFTVAVTDGQLSAATIVGFSITGASDAPAHASTSQMPAAWLS